MQQSASTCPHCTPFSLSANTERKWTIKFHILSNYTHMLCLLHRPSLTLTSSFSHSGFSPFSRDIPEILSSDYQGTLLGTLRQGNLRMGARMALLSNARFVSNRRWGSENKEIDRGGRISKWMNFFARLPFLLMFEASKISKSWCFPLLICFEPFLLGVLYIGMARKKRGHTKYIRIL